METNDVLDEMRSYLEVGRSFEHAIESQMFGKPCFKYNGKAFICFFQKEMVFKLHSDVRQEALSLEGAQLFDPSGKNRPMKEWIQVPFKHSDKWKYLAEEALHYLTVNI